ncbi:MAG: hypothetical protein NTW67_00825 [Candidatus Woesearchaeota archaeon]|nr:hypothetical protein [Candidatus Woesearchaeota archaeon]
MKRVWVLLVLLPSVLGAVIHGSVYDFGLNKLPNSVVEIDTSPRQQMVAVGGTYSFSVPPGNYTLSARFKDLDIDENISAVSDGDYVFDLILLPNVDELSVETPEVPLVEDVVQDAPVTSWLVWLFVFVVLGFIAYRVSRPRKIIREVADDLQKILEFVEKEGGRTTQKDIRKNFPYSEAKISLMIDDLEAKGLLKRIKKGRGNIIVK